MQNRCKFGPKIWDRQYFGPFYKWPHKVVFFSLLKAVWVPIIVYNILFIWTFVISCLIYNHNISYFLDYCMPKYKEKKKKHVIGQKIKNRKLISKIQKWTQSHQSLVYIHESIWHVLSPNLKYYVIILSTSTQGHQKHIGVLRVLKVR